ncbi:MAG: hypothetical protein ACLQGP_12810 [Isosphaeraceae bacterium]
MRLAAIICLLLASLMVGCAGSDAGSQAVASSSTPEQDAERVLAIAEDLEKQGDHKKAFAAYHQIIRNFPGTPSGKKAIERVKRAQRDAMRKPRTTKR